MAVVTTKTMKPYIVNRCETRRSGFANSLEVNTSFVKVLTARPSFSPPPTSRLAIFFSDCPFSKKYLALFLWTTSSKVPPMTRNTMRTT